MDFPYSLKNNKDFEAKFHECRHKEVGKCRSFYDLFFRRYPTAGKYWSLYAEHEFSAAVITTAHGAPDLSRVEYIMKRALLACPSFDLWSFYVKYTSRTAAASASPDCDDAGARASVQRAFEFALDHTGRVIWSTQLWLDYINFMKETPTTSQFEESRKTSAIRTLYQRAITNPMRGIDVLWNEYMAWEEGVSEVITQKKMVHDWRPKYRAAADAFRERSKVWQGIDADSLPVRPTPRPPAPRNPRHQANVRDRQAEQLALWQKLIAFEKANPQRCGTGELKERVRYAYKQALCPLRFYPELWFEFASYERQNGSADAAAEILCSGVDALPECLLLNFAYADVEEICGRPGRSWSIYERLAKDWPSPLVFIQFQRFARRAEGVGAARNIFRRARIAHEHSRSNVPHEGGAYSYVFVAAALQEYFCNKEAEASRTKTWNIIYTFSSALSSYYMSRAWRAYTCVRVRAPMCARLTHIAPPAITGHTDCKECF